MVAAEDPNPVYRGRPPHPVLPLYKPRKGLRGGGRVVSITMSQAVLEALDERVLAGKGSRSELIERYVAGVVCRKRRAA